MDWIRKKNTQGKKQKENDDNGGCLPRRGRKKKRKKGKWDMREMVDSERRKRATVKGGRRIKRLMKESMASRIMEEPEDERKEERTIVAEEIKKKGKGEEA